MTDILDRKGRPAAPDVVGRPLWPADVRTVERATGRLPDRATLLAGPVWFGDPAMPLAGWLHTPAAASGSSVVLCPPLFSEYVSAQHAYLCLARQLADAGVLVVRFDYYGTGDSAGPMGPMVGPGRGTAATGTGQVAAWLDSIDRAVDLARSCADGAVGLVGMRMGALLAAVAADRRGDVDAMVLWDPCESGKGFLRRQRSLLALESGAAPSAELVEVPGVALDMRTATELSALRLPPTFAARRTLVLARAHSGSGEVTAGIGRTEVDSGVAALAGAVEHRPIPPREQESLLEVDPFFRELPSTGMEHIGRWLPATLAALSQTGPAAGASSPGRRTSAAPAQPATEPAAIPSGATTGKGAPGADDAGRAGDAGDAVHAVHERVRWLGPVPLFAIETAPVDPRAAAGLPTVVFLTTGNDRHIGPSRLWVDLARQWAGAGYRCFRVDLSGLGESSVRVGQREQVVRSIEAFDDVADVVRAVADDPHQVVLVGLCSGAYQAFESALEVRPLGVLAVNPLLRFIAPEMAAGSRVSPRRRICDPRPSWVKVLRRRLPAWIGARGAQVRLFFDRRLGRHATLRWQQELVEQGVRVYCVCGPLEAAPIFGPHAGKLAGTTSSGWLRIEVVDDLDHALWATADRTTIVERLTTQLALIAAGPG